MAEKLQVQGHMKKALTRLDRIFGVVDGVLEVADGRAAGLTRFGHLLPRLAERNEHILVLTHADTADPKRLEEHARALLSPPRPSRVVLWHPRMNPAQILRWMRGPGGKTRRWVVVGLPNVGKSHLINRLAGRHLPKGNRPGVTRSLTWVRAEADRSVEILDSPGLLPPKVKHPWHRSALRMLRVMDEQVEVQDVLRLLTLLWPDYAEPLQNWLGRRADDPAAFLEQARGRFGIQQDEDFEKTAVQIFKALDQGKVKFSLALTPAFPEISEEVVEPETMEDDPWR